jgi:hypothetical protein
MRARALTAWPTPLLTEDPAKKAFNTYKLGRAIFRTALCVIIAAGMCYLAGAWIWVTAPSRPSPTSKHLRAACLVTKDCQAPTWSGRNNGAWNRVRHCAVCRAAAAGVVRIYPKFRPGVADPYRSVGPARG